jgi:Cu(I)/Ag(I) efflux system membrane fusion protein
MNQPNDETRETGNQKTEQEPEGAEPPPRGVRVMAFVRWSLLAAVALVAVASVTTYCSSETHEQGTARADRYWCPMHHEIRSPDPGQCPICHMDLVPIPPEMQKQGSSAAAGGHEGHGTASPPATPRDAYWCPMHHEVRSPDPGQCRICHMDLVPIPPEEREPGAASPPPGPSSLAPVPGVTPVTLALDRRQLGGIETGPAVVRAVGGTLRLPAAVEAPQTSLAHVHVRTPGFVERVAVRETGVRVGRGQPLAWVYSPEVYQAQIELLAARRWSGAPDATGAAVPVEEGRMRQVAAAGRTALELRGMAPQDIDAVLRAGEPMRAVPVRAPSAGYVVGIQAVLGMYATEEMVLYEISDQSRVWVVGSVFPADIPRVRAGMSGRFVPATGDEPVAGVVELIEPEVGATTRTARLRLAVDNPDLRLRPGQYGDILIDLPGREALVVPRDAVVDTGEHQYVFVDRGEGRLEPRPVRAGGLFDEQREVVEGLSPGDVVVTRGAFLVDSESRLAASITHEHGAT